MLSSQFCRGRLAETLWIQAHYHYAPTLAWLGVSLQHTACAQGEQADSYPGVNIGPDLALSACLPLLPN